MKKSSIKNNHKSYTYLLGWSKHDLWYYGVRFSKRCSPEDLWVKYKTSSKYVKETVEMFGDPDIIQVRNVFDSVEKARIWEQKILRRLQVVNNPKWLNKTDNVSIAPECAAKAAVKNRGKKRPGVGGAPKGRVPWNKGLKNDPRCIENARKTAETRKKTGKYVSWCKGSKGLINAWNKGLTKETDDRVAEYGKQQSITKQMKKNKGKKKDG